MAEKQIDLTPHATIEAGERGTVYCIDQDTGEVWIRLDTFHPGLCDWDNCIWLNEYTEDVWGSLLLANWQKALQAA
jgi:hypothetical protein